MNNKKAIEKLKPILKSLFDWNRKYGELRDNGEPGGYLTLSISKDFVMVNNTYWGKTETGISINYLRKEFEGQRKGELWNINQ